MAPHRGQGHMVSHGSAILVWPILLPFRRFDFPFNISILRD
jgi:hypothetical protein